MQFLFPNAPAAPLPCRGGVAVGRGGVSNLSHAEAQREPTPALPEGREDARRENLTQRNRGSRERPTVADSPNSERLLLTL